MEQACCSSGTTQAQSSVSGLSLQQSRQVLGVLEEAFSAVVYHLQQVTGRSSGFRQTHPGNCFIRTMRAKEINGES